jgi:hypothetical protein
MSFNGLRFFVDIRDPRTASFRKSRTEPQASENHEPNRKLQKITNRTADIRG